MNRRSFFKSLALLGAGAVVAPNIFIPKIESVKWKSLPIDDSVFASTCIRLFDEQQTQQLHALADAICKHIEVVRDPETGLYLQCATWQHKDTFELKHRVEIMNTSSYDGNGTRFWNQLGVGA
jgi:hypothetical protein